MKLDYDVIVVGGGPAGASAATACVLGSLKTLLLEKRKLPRPKACSGILIPASIELLSRHFGEIPRDVLAEPAGVESLRMHFPSGRLLDVPIEGLWVRRDRLDEWLCLASGGEIVEQATLDSFEETADRVTVHCLRRNGKPFAVSCRALIAADGGTSGVVRQIDPDRYRKLAWYTALQESWDAPSGLEPGRFHFFAFPSISLYPSAYVKDGRIVMEVVAPAKESAAAAMDRFRDFLRERIEMEHRGGPVTRLGCRVAYAAPRGLFCFGTRRVLVAGEASGLLNLFGEGISSALASGQLAGEAAVKALGEGMPPGDLYAKAVEAEKRRNLRQFRFGAYLAGRNVTFDFRKGLAALSAMERIRLMSDLLRWLAALRRPAAS